MESSRGEERAATGSSAGRRTASSGVPRWVKASAAVAVAVVVLVVLAMLFGIGGEHGPGRHQSLSSPSAPALSFVGAVGGPAA
jgi:type VI protein secretion system component VasF